MEAVGELMIDQTKVQLDWKAYYKNFSIAHGGDPIMYGGRQLFQDGWTYSGTDYAGPEWPPPSNKVLRTRLIRTYWEKRKEIVVQQEEYLRLRIEALEGMQSAKNQPLQQVVRLWSDTEEKQVSQVGDINFDDLKEKLKFFQYAVQECQNKLQELNNE